MLSSEIDAENGHHGDIIIVSLPSDEQSMNYYVKHNYADGRAQTHNPGAYCARVMMTCSI